MSTVQVTRGAVGGAGRGQVMTGDSWASSVSRSMFAEGGRTVCQLRLHAAPDAL